MAGSATHKSYGAEIVEDLAQAQLVAQSAGALGVAVSDAELPAQVTQTERAYGGEAKVLTLLKGEGLTMALYKRTLKSQGDTRRTTGAAEHPPAQEKDLPLGAD